MNSRKFYYSISFIEGAAVMATEIIGAKFLAPLFGSSLYVWSSVMAMTLGGLAGGYFFGGRMSQKENTAKKLFLTLFLAGLFILLMPIIIGFISPLSLNMPLLMGVVVCSCLILIPPVFCMGMVSPLIVQLISDKNGESGKRAGEVYAISTIGGILATFLTGFYLIPQFGLSLPLFLFGGLLLMFSMGYFIKGKDTAFLLIAFFVVTAAILQFVKSARKEENIVYASEGMLGKLEVMERDWNMDSTQVHEKHRLLLINNVIQTWMECDSNKSYLEYVGQIERQVNDSLQSGKALVLGLGGGMVADVLVKKKLEVTAVELDERIIEIAREYFGLSNKVHVINDDARHAIERMDDKFDLIVVDLFNGEVTPSHVMSKESISKMQSLLNPKGKLVFNTYGYIQKPAGLGNLSLLKTLKACGLQYKIGRSGTIALEDYRNLLIVASSCSPLHVENELLENVAIEDASIITDNKPVLEYQNAIAAKRWRYYYIQNFIKKRMGS